MLCARFILSTFIQAQPFASRRIRRTRDSSGMHSHPLQSRAALGRASNGVGVQIEGETDQLGIVGRSLSM